MGRHGKPAGFGFLRRFEFLRQFMNRPKAFERNYLSRNYLSRNYLSRNYLSRNYLSRNYLSSGTEYQ